MKNIPGTPDALKPLYRGLPIIIAVVVLCVLTAKRYLHYATPMYESTAKIKLADTRDGVPNNNLYKDFDVFTSTNKIGTEVEVLKSPALIEKVAGRLDIAVSVFRVGDLHKKELYDQSPLIVIPGRLDPALLDQAFRLVISDGNKVQLTLPSGSTLKGKIEEPVQFPGGSLSIRFNEILLKAKPGLQINDHYELIIHSREMLVNDIIAGLDVTAVDKDIPVLRISFKSAVARKSADVVNAVAATYIADYIEEKYRSADTTESFLVNQLKAYSDKLTSSESQIQNYRDDKNIINIRQETETDLRKIADLKKQLASVDMNLKAVESLNRYIKAGKDNFTELAPNFQAFTDLLSTEIIKDMKHLQADKEDLLTRYTPENEKVQVVDQKISDLSRYLEESIRNTETDLRIKYNDLQQTIQASEAEFIGLPAKERNMTILERNFSLNEQIYCFLQEKKTDAQIAKAAVISFHRIIARGEVPVRPVSPNAKLIIVFAGFLGFLFSIIGIYTAHQAKGRVDNENVIYRNSDIPLANTIPFCPSPDVKEQVFSRWALEMELQGMLLAGSIITISSQESKEGKQHTATGLADAIATLGKKTLLISLQDRSISAAAIYDQSAPGREQWQIPSKRAALIAQWQKEYEIIIIENVPAVEAIAMIALSVATFNFFILDSRITKISAIGSTEVLREKLKLNNLSFVLNRVGYIPGLLSTMIQLFKRS